MAATELTAEEALKQSYSDTVAVEKVVSAPLPMAFAKFHEYVWLKNAGVGPESWTTIVAQGEDDSHAGETRMAAGLVKEKILRTIPNEEIMYTVVGGPFPVSNHLGIVRFSAESEDRTKIVWTVNFTPMMGMGLAVRGIIGGIFAVFLSRLDKLLQPGSAGPDMATPEEAANAEAQTYPAEIMIERVLSAPPSVAFEKFREFVWLRNAGLGPSSWTYIVDEGDKETHVGEVRRVNAVLDEKILRIIENELIVYSLIKGPVPFHNHLGLIAFAPEGEKTKITWTIKYTPMVSATKFAVDIYLKRMLGAFLERLDTELANPTTQ